MKNSLFHACFTCILLLTPIVSAESPVIVPDPEIQEQIEAAKSFVFETDVPGLEKELITPKALTAALKQQNENRLGVLIEQMVYNMANFSDEWSGYAIMVLVYSLDIDPVVVLRAAVPLLDSTQKGIAHETDDHVLGNLFAVEDGDGYDFDPLRRYLLEGGELTPSLASFALRYRGTGAFEAIAARYASEVEREGLVARAVVVSDVPSSFNQTRMLTDRQRDALESLSGDERWWVRLYVPSALVPAEYWIHKDRGELRMLLERLATDSEPAVRDAALEYLPRGWESEH